MADTKTSTSPTARGSALHRAAIPASLVMLVGWAVWTFAFDPAPGWVHLFLTLGVFLLIWGIVARDDGAPRGAGPRATPPRTPPR